MLVLAAVWSGKHIMHISASRCMGVFVLKFVLITSYHNMLPISKSMIKIRSGSPSYHASSPSFLLPATHLHIISSRSTHGQIIV